MAKQVGNTMKVDFTNMATAGHQNFGMEPTPPRVRFSSLQNKDSKSANDMVKSRYVKHMEGKDNTAIDNGKRSLPDIDSRLQVDHQHYEQWARVPNKRLTNTLLYRGIQQLKARAKRDGSEEDNRSYLYSRQMASRDFATRDVNTADAVVRYTDQRDSLPRLVSMKDIKLVQKDQLLSRVTSSKDAQQKDTPLTDIHGRQGTSKDREKTEAKVSRVSLKFKYIENTNDETSAIRRQGMFPNTSVESGFSRALSSIRHSTIDSNAIEQENEAKLEQDYQTRHEYLLKECNRPRHGTIKLRDRSPFPVSIKQPKYYGEPAYHLHEPYKHHELPKSKTRLELPPTETIAKSDVDKQETSTAPPKVELKLPSDMAGIEEEFYRSKSFLTSFPSKKHHVNRTPALVPSADFCDISQLEEGRHRHSAYSTLLERTRVESAYSCKTPHLLKWVPRVQRMKELLK